MFLTMEERKETINACRFCPMCYPADAVASKIKKMSCSPKGRSIILFLAEQGKLPWDEQVSDILYKFSTDGLCREWCVGNYDLDQLILDSRHFLATQGIIPEEVKRLISNVRSFGNPFGERNSTPLGEMVQEAGGKLTPEADLLLFFGCVARVKNSPSIKALIRILHLAGVPFSALEKETCCGGSLYETGDYHSAKEQASILAERIGKMKASEILMLDPECYRMFLTRYRRWNINLPHRIFHVSEYIWNLFEKGIIQGNHLLNERIVYHDPFQLARYAIDHDSPRKILTKINRSSLLEMRFNRARARCCGDAGALFFTNPDIAEEMAKDVLKEAKETKAKLIVTASPFSQFLLEKTCRDLKETGIRVKNIVELILDSLERT